MPRGKVVKRFLVVVSTERTMNYLSLTLGLRKESVSWQQTDSICTLTTAHPHRGEDVLYFPIGVKFTLTAKWHLLHFLICFRNCEVFHDKKLTQFLHFTTCIPVVHVVSWRKTDSVSNSQHASPLGCVFDSKLTASTFFNVFPHCEVLRDRKHSVSALSLVP